MKSIWIMKQVEESAEYKHTFQNSLWRRYIKRLIKVPHLLPKVLFIRMLI